jgi:DnaJ-class molecular chaperone
MEIKIYLFLLMTISAVAIISLAFGSVNQVDPEINIIDDISQSNALNSNNVSSAVKTKCSVCNGEGVVRCAECGGDGEIVKSIDCKKCDGSGKIYKNHNITNCPYCHDGQIVEAVTCSACNGTGWVKCTACNGKGII